MLKRYTREEMGKLWADETKFRLWLRVELAVVRARAKLGKILMSACEKIEDRASFDVQTIEQLEAEYGHDMLAFVGAVQESLRKAGVGDLADEFHREVTSYDIEDPALILLLRDAAKLILGKLRRLEETLRRKARGHKWTLMIFRTHGQFAEPSTFGHLLLVYAEAVSRSIARLEHVLRTELAEGKISGAVGNFIGPSPKLEEYALAQLELAPAKAETQILQRDRHAMFMAALTVTSGTIGQMCRTFWEMMRSDVGELEEPRKPRQRGSSYMPHKKNPILNEQFMGIPRLLRGYTGAALEDIETPEARDISQSIVERHIFPDATYLLYHQAGKAADLVEKLVVFPDVMKHNLERALGTWASPHVRAALMDAGLSYDASYDYAQKASFKAWESKLHLRDVLGVLTISEDDPRTAEAILGEEKLLACFDERALIQEGIEHIFRNE